MTMPDQTASDALPDETRINRDWPKTLALVAICLGLVAASLYGVQSEPDSYQERRFQHGSFFILPIFSVLSVFTVFRVFVPLGAPVRVNLTGFTDLRAGKTPIPWSEISNVVRKGEYVSLTLKRKYAKTYPFSWSQRALKASRKSAGPTHLLVAVWCLKTSSPDLLDIVSAYRDQA
ncbi:hypothetical protein [Roseibium sp. MMSF_3544]|uniref:hypothetical protein n=1 Tax=unclassified Roseibium TaxID=2629323 RepID=UPI00273DB424|nr:hypothetical protein [Roseibium sp. MMSF_3544]